MKWLWGLRSRSDIINDAKMWLYHPYVMTKKLAKKFMIEGHRLIFEEHRMIHDSLRIHSPNSVRSNICRNQRLSWQQVIRQCQDPTLKRMASSYNDHFLEGWRFWRNVVQHYHQNANDWEYTAVNSPIDEMRKYFHFEVLAFDILYRAFGSFPNWRELRIRAKERVFNPSLTKDA